MAAHHGIEQAELQPPDVKFLEQRILRTGGGGPWLIVSTGEESAYIGVEIRIAGKGESEPGTDLMAEIVPSGLDVAAPGIGASALLSGICRTRKHHRTPAGHGQLLGGHALHGHQRIGVQNTAVGAHSGHLLQVGVLIVEVVRFGRVHPPAVYAHSLQPEEIVPVDIARLGAESIVREDS